MTNIIGSTLMSGGVRATNSSANLEDAMNEIEKALEVLQNDMVDDILLGNESRGSVRSVYSMTAEEYMELPGNVRL